jgi:hypothetical protein
MTIIQPHPPDPPPPKRPRHDVAIWAAFTAFFGSLATIAVFDILDPAQWVEFFGALIVAAITAGGVYAKERLDEAKRERGEV